MSRLLEFSHSGPSEISLLARRLRIRDRLAGTDAVDCRGFSRSLLQRHSCYKEVNGADWL